MANPPDDVLLELKKMRDHGVRALLAMRGSTEGLSRSERFVAQECVQLLNVLLMEAQTK